MKLDAEKVPTWSRNLCPNASQINPKTDIEQNQANHENSYFLKGETFQFIVNTIIFLKV